LNWVNRKLSWFWALFPDTKKMPLIPAALPLQYRKPFVMVIDMEVLLSSQFEGGRGWRAKKRPGVDYFLALAGQVCEIIVFSSKVNPSVGWTLVPRLDAAGAISYKFFDDTYKDIPSLERPIERTLIVTDSPEEYAGQEANIVVMPRWTGGDEEDTSLLELAAFIEDLSRNQAKIADTRKVLKNLASTGKSVTEAYREVAKQKLEKKEEVLSGRRVGFLQ
jgi:TFIIF-interacting CTD phosphatase-like protein